MHLFLSAVSLSAELLVEPHLLLEVLQEDPLILCLILLHLQEVYLLFSTCLGRLHPYSRRRILSNFWFAISCPVLSDASQLPLVVDVLELLHTRLFVRKFHNLLVNGSFDAGGVHFPDVQVYLVRNMLLNL